MRIQYINPVSCGNAIKLIVQPTVGEVSWKILRKETNDFTGQDDPAAYLVYEGNYGTHTDCRMLVNGVAYFYKVYGQSSTGAWSESTSATATPNATFVDNSTDAQEFVRERIDDALVSMIARGLLSISRPVVPVQSIPFYTQGTEFPVVTVLYSNGASADRAAGDEVSSGDGGLVSFDGWYCRVSLEVSVWSLNAQERNVLRKAVQTAIATNLALFGEYGLDLFEVHSIADEEDVSSMNAPIYKTLFHIVCQVLISTADQYSAISSVTVTGQNTTGGQWE